MTQKQAEAIAERISDRLVKDWSYQAGTFHLKAVIIEELLRKP